MIIRDAPLEDVRQLLEHPDIYNRVTDDSCRQPFEVPKGPRYWGWYEDDAIKGLYIEHATPLGAKMHLMVVPECRARASWFLRRCLAKSGQSVYVEIPMKYPEVILFVKRHGFDAEGQGESRRIYGKRYPSILMRRSAGAGRQAWAS